MSSGDGLRRASALVTAVVLVVLAGCSIHHSRGWKLADLDRNWLNLATARGVEDASALAEGMPQGGTVLSTEGLAKRALQDQPDPMEIVVRYDGGEAMYGDVPDECFRFTFPDGYRFEFTDVDCPEEDSSG